MNWGQFKDLVRSAVNRGETLDNVLPSIFENAVRQVETQHDFIDLEWWRRFTLEKDQEPIIEIPPNYKRIDFVRLNFEANPNNDPKWRRLDRARPGDLVNRTGYPDRFWINGRKFLVLDATPERDFAGEILLHRLSEIPTDDEANHWLLTVAPQVLYARVMLDLAAFQIKEQGSADWQIYQNQWEQGLEKLIDNDNRNRDSGSEPEMSYWPDWLNPEAKYQMRGDYER